MGRLQDCGPRGDGHRHIVDFDVDHFHDVSHTPLFLDDGAEFALLHTGAALDALGLVDHMGHLDGAFDGANGAGTGAEGAAFALIGEDGDLHQVFADAGGALLVHDVGDVFIPEVPEGGEDGIGSGLAQAAEGVGLDVVAKLLHLVQIFQRRLAPGDLVEHLVKTLGAHPAGGTFAAGLVHGEFEEEFGNVHHTGVLVHDDQSAGAHHGADGDQVVVVDGHVHMLSGNAAAGGTAGLSRFEFLAVGDAAADLFDDLPEGGAHGDFHQAGVLDLAAQSEDLGAFGLLGSHGGEPVRTLQDDLGDVGVGFHVIQDSGFLEQTLDRREGRTGTGLAPVAFDGGHQCGLLATDERTCAQTEVDVKVKAGAEDVFAQ